VQSGGWAEDVSDPDVVAGIQLLAETEGVFTETAGGVTTAVAQKLYAQGRIHKDESTVICITGNGLKTTDVLTGRYAEEPAIRPRLKDFEDYLNSLNALPTAVSAAPDPVLVAGGDHVS
jgi:threonine synthase